MGYIRSSNRHQQTLFPSTIDEYVEESNPVRVIDAFTGMLDFKELGFKRGEAAETGRPGYEPRQLMGLYIWGHLNQVRSSRRLEKECGRNLEVIWLMENLRPDFKTIADFRKDNVESIKEVVVKFRLWCIDEGLYGQKMVSIDGSKFQGVNSRDRNYNEKRLKKIIERESAQVEQYLKDLEEADQQESEEGRLSAEQLEKKVSRMRENLARHEELVRRLKESGDSQLSVTDEDARLMNTNNGGYEVGFNVQMVVDDKHKLIAEYEVTNEGSDKGQLGDMAKKGKEALLVEELSVLADKGYFDGNEIKECEKNGINAYVAEQRSSAEGRGIFSTDRFSYDEKRDLFICPQGEELTFRTKEERHDKLYKIYRTDACSGCPIRRQCTTSKTGRKLRRWEDQEVLDRLRERMLHHPEMMKKRKSLAEHPFGTIKRAMGHRYFLMKSIKKVTIEIGLTVLAYNLRRAIKILGAEVMINSMKLIAA